MPPINNFTEKVAKLAEDEEEAVAEVSCQGGQIRNGDHFVWRRLRSDPVEKINTGNAAAAEEEKERRRSEMGKIISLYILLDFPKKERERIVFD